jgi:hypothetical protein
MRQFGVLVWLSFIAPWLVVTKVHADSPAMLPGDWQFESVVLTNGTTLHGLIVSDSPSGIRFLNIRRQPGRPTVIFTTTFDRREVARVQRLPPDDRRNLAARIKELEQSSGQAEREQLRLIQLRQIPWGSHPSGGWKYASDHFTLSTDAPEEVVRRVAFRLEQIYAAYTRFLPPRHEGGPPTQVILHSDLTGYKSLLDSQRRPFINPAFFDPGDNRIICGSDLRVLGTELTSVRRDHAALRAEIDRQESDLRRLYKGKELARLLTPLQETRQRIDRADQRNLELFDKATRQLFANLYHEAFHAYLLSFVYPSSSSEVPRWLNEGLAQIFETAFIEAGELRIGHADSARLSRVKESLRKKDLVSFDQLLRSGPHQFQQAHAGERQVTDRYYLASWALAFHLTFERRLLGSESMNRYVAALKNGTDPHKAFVAMIGQPIDAFTAEYMKYLQQLETDGTVRASAGR